MNKRWLKRMDFTLIGATAAIIVMSLIIIGSATHINTAGGDHYWFVQKQGAFVILNVLFAIFLMNFDYKALQSYGRNLYIFNAVMLLLVMLIGQTALGAQRWIQLGPITLQPSEFSKIIMIIALAAVLEDRVGKLNTLNDILPVVAYVALPFFLVLKQPDLGTSLVFIAILLGMLFVAGVNLRILTAFFAAGVAMSPLLWLFLKDYQKMRLKVFLDPSVDPLGSGYHIIQSKIAIGSGLIFGKGLSAARRAS